MLADGKSTVGIASDLVVSIETVRSHVKAVLRKLRVHTRVAAIACLEEIRESAELAVAASARASPAAAPSAAGSPWCGAARRATR